MANSPKKKGGKKKGRASKKSGITTIYPVSKGAFAGPPDKLLQNLLVPEVVLPRLVLYKEDVIYLLSVKPADASRLITFIRKNEQGLAGRWVTGREFSMYTGISRERVFCYLLSLTVNKRILS
jgi:hypothetical protein